MWCNSAGLFLGSRPTQKSKRLPTTTAEALSSVWDTQVWNVLVVSFQKYIFSSHGSIVLTPLAGWHSPKAPQCIVWGNLYFPKLNFHTWKEVEVSSNLLKASWKKLQKQFTSDNFQMRHKREWKLPPEPSICLLLNRTLRLTASMAQDCAKRDKFEGAHFMKAGGQKKRLEAGLWCMRHVCH